MTPEAIYPFIDCLRTALVEAITELIKTTGKKNIYADPKFVMGADGCYNFDDAAFIPHTHYTERHCGSIIEGDVYGLTIKDGFLHIIICDDYTGDVCDIFPGEFGIDELQFIYSSYYSKYSKQ